MQTLRPIDAQTLRELAERAAGARGPQGDPYYLVEEGGPNERFLVLGHGTPDEAPPEGAVLEIDTYAQQARRPPVTHASISSEGKTFRLDEKYDAVFWSESAVEKFLFPYYASKSMWYAAYVLCHLSQLWYGFVPRPPVPGTEAEEEEEEIPFAIAHIPDSEYVGLSLPAGYDLHLLFRTKHGAVKARPLSELIQEREAEARGTADRATRNPASPDGG